MFEAGVAPALLLRPRTADTRFDRLDDLLRAADDVNACASGQRAGPGLIE